MITQSQYFEIEDYFQHECRIIEPELLEELIDHFMDGIKGMKQSEDDFAEAFERVKADFGGKAEVRKIQRRFQVNYVKINSRKTVQEILGYFQAPKIYWLLTFVASVFVFTFYFKTGIIPERATDFSDGFLGGFALAYPLLVIMFLVQNRFDLGVWGLQARNLYSIVWVFGLTTLLISLISLAKLFPGSPISQLIHGICAVSVGFVYFVVVRYSNRELYTENA